MEFIREKDLPDGFTYPEEFLKVVDLNLVDITITLNIFVYPKLAITKHFAIVCKTG